MKQMLFILILSVLSTASSFAFFNDQDLQMTCEASTREKPWKFCIYKQLGSTNQDVLYYFHGAGGSEREYNNLWSIFRDNLRQRKLMMPTVISFSFGPIWILADKNSSPQSGRLPYVIETVFPYMESKVGGLKGQRLLLSRSMGSFNTSQLLMRFPEKFARAALACPAITTLSPFATNAELDAFVKNTPGADRLKVFGNIRMQRTFFYTPEEWEKADPLVIGHTLLNENTPPLYISGATQDDYGFYSGGETFARIATSKRTSDTMWTAHEGGHCALDENAIARFLF